MFHYKTDPKQKPCLNQHARTQAPLTLLFSFVFLLHTDHHPIYYMWIYLLSVPSTQVYAPHEPREGTERAPPVLRAVSDTQQALANIC